MLKIDTTNLDSMASSYVATTQSANPIDILSETSDGLTVAESMFYDLEQEAMRIMGGVAVYIDPLFAASVNNPEEAVPSHVYKVGEACFTGRLVSLVGSFDFTFAHERSGFKSENRVLAPGLIFENDESLEALAIGSLGVIMFSPYSVIMPGSLYTVKKLLAPPNLIS